MGIVWEVKSYYNRPFYKAYLGNNIQITIETITDDSPVYVEIYLRVSKGYYMLNQGYIKSLEEAKEKSLKFVEDNNGIIKELIEKHSKLEQEKRLIYKEDPMPDDTLYKFSL